MKLKVNLTSALEETIDTIRDHFNNDKWDLRASFLVEEILDIPRTNLGDALKKEVIDLILQEVSGIKLVNHRKKGLLFRKINYFVTFNNKKNSLNIIDNKKDLNKNEVIIGKL